MKLFKGLIIMLILNLSLFSLTSCQTNSTDTLAYDPISPEEAKTLMDTETDYVILDVRTAEEYAEGHIPNAVNLDHEDVPSQAEAMFPDKDALILVYCRSGRRSADAGEVLTALGYKRVADFGGILLWPYEVVTEP